MLVLLACTAAIVGALVMNNAGGNKRPPQPAAPISPPPVVTVAQATYAGAETCTECHAAQAQAWRASHHALAMQHATDATVLGNFNQAQISHGGVTSRFFRRDGKFMVRTDGADGALHDYEVQFTFGVDPLQQYLVAFDDGRMQALPFAWDARPKAEGGQRWFHLYPREKLAHDDPLHWTGLQQNWNFMCAECHSTNLLRNYDARTQRYATTYSQINVSCEACHGPGSTHVSWAKREPGYETVDRHDKGLVVALDERVGVDWVHDAATGNSRRNPPLTTHREVETCALCHSRRGQIWERVTAGAAIGDSHRVAVLQDGLYFPDGQIRDEVYEHGSFLQSRMFHAGVTCSDCHDPHSATLRAPGNGVCLQCHSTEKYSAAEHHHHRSDSPGAACVACHMPERTYMLVDRRRDHSIRIPRPDLTLALGTPNACNACHADKTPAWAADRTRQWFGASKPGFQQFATVLRNGTTGAPGAREQLIALAKDSSQPGIARASALERLDRIPDQAALGELRTLLRDPDALVRRAAAGAYAGAPAQARQDVLPLLDDPVRDVRLEATNTLAALPAQGMGDETVRRRDRAIDEYIAAQRTNAERPDAQHNLGVFFMRLGRNSDAEAAFKQALALDPSFVPAAVTLADLYRASGRDAEGESVLRAMIARRPDEPAPHQALGLWLIRQGKTPAAMPELKRAADLAAADPHYRYVYAIAVAESGARDSGLRILRQIVEQHPYDRDSLYALALFERDAGNAQAAKPYAERLAELEPDSADIRALLLQLQQAGDAPAPAGTAR